MEKLGPRRETPGGIRAGDARRFESVMVYPARQGNRGFTEEPFEATVIKIKNSPVDQPGNSAVIVELNNETRSRLSIGGGTAVVPEKSIRRALVQKEPDLQNMEKDLAGLPHLEKIGRLTLLLLESKEQLYHELSQGTFDNDVNEYTRAHNQLPETLQDQLAHLGVSFGLDDDVVRATLEMVNTTHDSLVDDMSIHTDLDDPEWPYPPPLFFDEVLTGMYKQGGSLSNRSNFPYYRYYKQIFTEEASEHMQRLIDEKKNSGSGLQ